MLPAPLIFRSFQTITQDFSRSISDVNLNILSLFMLKWQKSVSYFILAGNLTYPILDQNGLNLYPFSHQTFGQNLCLFSDQNSSQIVGVVHTYVAYTREQNTTGEN